MGDSSSKVVPESNAMALSGLHPIDGEGKGVEEGKEKGMEKEKGIVEGMEKGNETEKVIGEGNKNVGVVVVSGKGDLTKNEDVGDRINESGAGNHLATLKGFGEDTGGPMEEEASGDVVARGSQPIDPQKDDVPPQAMVMAIKGQDNIPKVNEEGGKERQAKKMVEDAQKDDVPSQRVDMAMQPEYVVGKTNESAAATLVVDLTGDKEMAMNKQPGGASQQGRKNKRPQEIHSPQVVPFDKSSSSKIDDNVSATTDKPKRKPGRPKMKASTEGDAEAEEVQKRPRGIPRVSEGNKNYPIVRAYPKDVQVAIKAMTEGRKKFVKKTIFRTFLNIKIKHFDRDFLAYLYSRWDPQRKVLRI
ncbi:uncharacterized protein LOC110706827 [Chenopodium quinoa]|uniref:uncharacterized protein LOC110706827 n=1 Tax=Chenopodium quinoa TaxID=63459 RepID=UPI000B76D0AD|nr:uncharacterized protein LOC110706827 [Chenopodium quinoa]